MADKQSVVASLAVNVVANTKDFDKKLKKSKFQIRSFSDGVNSAKQVVASKISQMSGIAIPRLSAIASAAAAAGAGLVAVGTAAFMMANSVTVARDKLGKTAENLGMTGAQLQKFQIAAGRSGVAIDELTDGLRTMRQRLAEAAKGEGEAGKAFRQLGINIAEVSKLDTEGQFMAIAAAMDEARKSGKSAAEQQQLLQKVMGESAGFKMQLLMKNNAEALTAAAQKQAQMGGGITQESLDRAAQFQDSVGDLVVSFGELSASIVDLYGDDLIKAMKQIEQLVDAITRLVKQTDALFEKIPQIPTAGKVLMGMSSPSTLPSAAYNAARGIGSAVFGGNDSQQSPNRAKVDTTTQPAVVVRGAFR